MRNKYTGPCYRCGETVPPGEGYFEKDGRRWLTQHVLCCRVFAGTGVGKTEPRRKPTALCGNCGKEIYRGDVGCKCYHQTPEQRL